MNEKQVVNRISKIFTKNNRQYFNIKGDAFGNKAGTPDVVAYPDFSIEDLDNETIPKVTFVDEEMTISKTTTEIIL